MPEVMQMLLHITAEASCHGTCTDATDRVRQTGQGDNEVSDDCGQSAQSKTKLEKTIIDTVLL